MDFFIQKAYIIACKQKGLAMLFKKKKRANKEHHDIICDLLENKEKSKRGFCVCLAGGWGTGKTYRCLNDIVPYFDKRQIVYISGFGKTDLSEFKLELLDKLLKNKHFIVKIFTWFTCSIISTIIIGGIIFTVVGFANKTWFWTTLLSIWGVLAILSLYYYTSLVKYFSTKILGVDHNNIDFKRIWAIGSKPIICFDDIERVSLSEDCCRILGFVEELKNFGYPILLIINPSANNSGLWKKFKEKVVDRTIKVEPTKNTFKSVLSKYSFLDKVEKEYLEIIFNIWCMTYMNKEKVDEYDNDIIFLHIKSNFRLLEAIIRNIELTRKYVKNYSKLEKSIKLSLLSYVGLYTLVTCLEIDDKHIYKDSSMIIDGENSIEQKKHNIKQLYVNVVKGEQILTYKDPKRFGDMVVVQWPFGYEQLLQVQQFLDTNNISKSIVFSNKISKTEMFANKFKPFFSRTPEIQQFVVKLQDMICSEKEPFSTIDSMGSILTNLCLCYEFLGKKFNVKDFDWVLPIIDKTIRKKSLPLDTFINNFNQLIRLGTIKSEEYHYKAGEYLNKKFVEYGIKSVIDRISQIKTFWNDLITSYRNRDIENIAYLYVLFSNKQKQQELFKMKKDNYKRYVDIMNYVIASANYSYAEELKKQLSGENTDFIPALKDLLRKDIMSISKLSKAGIAEHNIIGELLNQLEFKG